MKSLLADGGHTPFFFEKISICLDNLTFLNPDLIILGSLGEQQVFRFLYALELIGTIVPILIISDLRSIKQFLDLNGYAEFALVRSGLVSADIDLAVQNKRLRQGGEGHPLGFPIIVGNTAAMVQIKKMIPDLSRSREKLLIVGEQGTGRELLAKAIHRFAGGQNESFFKINPTGLQQLVDNHEVLLQSAAPAQNGVPAGDANRRTIFIGDVDEVPEQQQLFLFYLLQVTDRQVSFSGRQQEADTRIIASAKSNLEKMVDDGLFRKGLYYRLNVIHIDLPPLRHRPEDIPLLVDYFSDQICLQMKKSFWDISDETKDSLSKHFWTGNVNELKNVVECIISNGNEQEVLASLSRRAIHRSGTGSNSVVEDIYTLAELSEIKNYLTDLTYISLKEICQEFITRIEKKLMAKALSQANGNRKKAALMLDISYKSLLNKIKDYNLQ